MSATVLDTCVVSRMPAAGPIMNDTSTDIESSENAERRCSPGTSAVSTCRPIAPAGIASRPAGSAMTSSNGYGRCGALVQYAVETVVQTATIGRKPCRSISRPIIGAPSAVPAVVMVPINPAAP